MAYDFRETYLSLFSPVFPDKTIYIHIEFVVIGSCQNYLISASIFEPLPRAKLL